MKTKSLIVVAIFSAIICIISPFSLYIGAIPVTLGLFAVSLCAALLGSKRGVAAVLIYILIGLVGLPVFSGFVGGFHVLLRHTGGFIVGYIPCAFIIGFGCERFSFKGHLPLFLALGTIACNLCGAIGYMLVTGVDFLTAFKVCVLTFMPTDVVKILGCTALVSALRKPLNKFLE